MKKLTRRQEILYGFSGFGPNLLMIIISAYIIDAFSTAGFVENVESWTFANKTIVTMGVFTVLVTIAKIIDGIIDIPLASFTDRLKTRWGKRRPAIFIGLIPMILAYIAICNPLSHSENSMLNTIWSSVALVIFLSAYTLCLVTYYATFAEIVPDTRARVRLSSYKSVFDTISYSIAYALIPLIIGFKVNIGTIALMATPLMLTMLIPLFLIKEKSTRAKDLNESEIEINKKEELPLIQSVKKSFLNKNFMIWMAIFGVFFFGLQMFLTGQNVLASGPMGLKGWQIAVLNTAAFAPVPLMLYIYNRVMKKRGFRFAFQSAVLAFGIAMIFFCLAYVELFDSWYIRLALGVTGSTIGSYGIGAFFSAPYIIPSHIAAEERRKTGKSNPAMYFATQGFINAIITAISTGVIWLNIKQIEKGDNIVFGAHLMTYIVIASCFIAFFLAFKLPKYFDEIGRLAAPSTSQKEPNK